MWVTTRPLAHSHWLVKLAAASVFTLLTAMAAQVDIHLPFTPVPITLQVLPILLAGLLLGSRWGALSQVEYLTAGALGYPVFAGGAGGVQHLWGPSGGYLWGFLAAAYLVGFVVERSGRERALVRFLASLTGVAVIYALGGAWLSVWLQGTQGVSLAESLVLAWQQGIAPFVVIDLLKGILATLLADGSLALWSWLEPALPGEPHR